MRRFWISPAAAVAAAAVSALLYGATSASAQTLCDKPQETCGRLVPQKCLSRVGAGSLAASDDCAPAQESYRECLALAAQNCTGETSSGRTQSGESAAASGDPALTKRVGRRGDLQITLKRCTVFEKYLTCDLELVSLKGDRPKYYAYGYYNPQKRSLALLPGASEPISASDVFLEGGDAGTYTYFSMKQGKPVKFSVGFHNDAVKALKDGDVLPELTVTLEYKGFLHGAVLKNAPISR